jgi:hypothetical protein
VCTDNEQYNKKIKLFNSSRSTHHLTEQNDKHFYLSDEKEQCREKLSNNQNSVDSFTNNAKTACSLSSETPLSEGINCASLTLRKNLLPIQIDALACARRVLFSCLAGLDEPLTKDPDHNTTISFTTQRLYQVMKALHITCSYEDVNAMMLYWNQEDAEHSHPFTQLKSGLCQECWTNDFDLKEREKLTRSIRKNKVTQKPFTLKPLECNWNQFCRIFKACNLKVEKNGVVW